ncbi:ribonuclease P protein component [candidate division KSB1 bacterium]|nr:ribonuclease P protein component [candidate division KSB1 bacterium]
MNRNDLSKEYILKGRDSFRRLFENGIHKHGKYVTIIYLKADGFKIGFAVSKKIKGAVRRNRLKRQLREIYRIHKSLFPAETEIVLLAKREDVHFKELKEDIGSLLDELTLR